MANEQIVNCPMKEEDGNCLACDMHCTDTPMSICVWLHKAYRRGARDKSKELGGGLDGEKEMG